MGLGLGLYPNPNPNPNPNPIPNQDEGRQLTIRTVRLERPAPLSAPPGGDMVEHRETRAYVDGKPRALTWPGAPPADGSWRIEEVEL